MYFLFPFLSPSHLPTLSLCLSTSLYVSLSISGIAPASDDEDGSDGDGGGDQHIDLSQSSMFSAIGISAGGRSGGCVQRMSARNSPRCSHLVHLEMMC